MAGRGGQGVGGVAAGGGLGDKEVAAFDAGMPPPTAATASCCAGPVFLYHQKMLVLVRGANRMDMVGRYLGGDDGQKDIHMRARGRQRRE